MNAVFEPRRKQNQNTDLRFTPLKSSYTYSYNTNKTLLLNNNMLHKSVYCYSTII